MLQKTFIVFRYRTAWRELLHPLPVWARHDQWLKRDTVEMNEAILRRPYYTIKSYLQPAFVDREALFSSSSLEDNEDEGSSSRRSSTKEDYRTPHHPSYTMVEQLKHRHVTSPEMWNALRNTLTFPGQVGPPLPLPSQKGTLGGRGSEERYSRSYEDEYGGRLRPRYPQSWDTVPPHQPSTSRP